MTYLEELESAIVKSFGFEAHSPQVFPVEIEGFTGNVVRFEISGHPKAKYAYAWEAKPRWMEGFRITCALGLPPVKSAEWAVGMSQILDHPDTGESRDGE
jgi:hypothetical protein